MARRVHEFGEQRARQLSDLEPDNPPLHLSPDLDVSLIPEDLLDLYRARRSLPRFEPKNIVGSVNRAQRSSALLNNRLKSELNVLAGSNNWVVNGDKTFSRYPIMANDPHRSQQIPSLRYFAHLVAPGWNVIGGGEPGLPGLSIGHNQHGAWGLTIFSVDQEDLYVYVTNPDNPNQYKYGNKWQNMKIIKEQLTVKGEKPVAVELKYTQHGPVVFEDLKNNLAYAVRAAWLEIGAAPYLASLRMDQARTWEEFREACSYSLTPSENMVWADKKGNIGWQAVGITPVRKNWYGLLPVPGDGRYEWEGFLDIKKLPNLYNPPQGYITTANENNVPLNYPVRLGYSWAEPFRVNRIKEVLESGKKFTIADMMRLQQDELSIPARNIVPLFARLKPEKNLTQEALEKVLGWDFVMGKNSAAATIYSYLETRLRTNLRDLFRKNTQSSFILLPSLSKLIQILHAPDTRFGSNPLAVRDSLLLKSFEQAIVAAKEKLGPYMNRWEYGQEKVHYIRLRHMLSRAVNVKVRTQLDLKLLPRGGNSSTVNNTGSGNQRSGASFRIIADTGNWDNSVATNNPGQSGDPASFHYSDLYEMWANGDYFPLLFTRARIEQAAGKITVLIPK